ncbi:MAG TPA: hypothetical protein VJ997_13270, partial [Longimicrobiales bacterium]|nr:hypothetical protein [Longimicrobiales bacterium]
MTRWAVGLVGLVGLLAGGSGSAAAQHNDGTSWAPAAAARIVRGCCDNAGPPTLDAVRVAEGVI